MSTNMKYLALRLEGPLQSWGFDSQYNLRKTSLFPTKSAIAGMFCAAFGYARGDNKELKFLEKFNKLHMLCISIPRKLGNNAFLKVRRMHDYHTVGGGYNPNNHIERDCITVSAKDGKPRAENGQSLAVLTNRHYLSDALFGVLLQGDSDFVSGLADAIQNPVWGIWLGRKNCIPSSPVFAGIKDNKQSALQLLIGENQIEKYTCQEDVKSFSDGIDSLNDLAVSFNSDKRSFSLRRVKIVHGKP
ncbi:MAG TPA: type I-E CRISPR-associated protein Cas5/CasD [Chitinispirillaceae bacterium]|nr:type I-E CRISPR-associated protein Cas5/CasD [Chitinispirillaceae bacterium]